MEREVETSSVFSLIFKSLLVVIIIILFVGFFVFLLDLIINMFSKFYD